MVNYYFIYTAYGPYITEQEALSKTCIFKQLCHFHIIQVIFKYFLQDLKWISGFFFLQPTLDILSNSILPTVGVRRSIDILVVDLLSSSMCHSDIPYTKPVTVILWFSFHYSLLNFIQLIIWVDHSSFLPFDNSHSSKTLIVICVWYPCTMLLLLWQS